MTKSQYAAIIAVIVVLFGLYAYISRNPAGVGDDDTPPPSSVSNSKTVPPVPQPSEAQMQSAWSTLVSQADSPPIASPTAPYTLIEIGDFQCPMCGKCAPLIEDLIRTQPKMVKVYFFNYPLPMHPHANFAAAAALAAAKQGKFWPMYGLLYSHQDELIPSEVEYYTEQSIPSINLQEFENDFASPSITEQIANQVTYLKSIQIWSTPTFLVRRSDGGPVHIYIGIKDTATSKGLRTLVSSPPWKSGT